jgi:hypothetical protein
MNPGSPSRCKGHRSQAISKVTLHRCLVGGPAACQSIKAGFIPQNQTLVTLTGFFAVFHRTSAETPASYMTLPPAQIFQSFIH